MAVASLVLGIISIVIGVFFGSFGLIGGVIGIVGIILGVQGMILSRLVDTFISRISLTMLPVPNPHNTVCVLSGEEARHWQSRSSGYSSS